MEAEPGITITYRVGFAAAERDGGAVHGPYELDLGHVASNNLRREKEHGRDKQNWLLVFQEGMLLGEEQGQQPH